MERRKGMSGVPTVVEYVHHDRNTGSPTGRESYGDGHPIVVGGVTPSQGDSNTVHRAKGVRELVNLEIMGEAKRDATIDPM